jgi:hypothetical protein
MLALLWLLFVLHCVCLLLAFGTALRYVVKRW